MADTNFTSNPFPTGLLKPGANYATTNVALLSNLTMGLQSSNVHSYLVRASNANTGTIYICNSSANANTSTMANVLDVLQGGGTSYATTGALNGIDATQIWIGASDANQSATAEIFWS